MFDGSKKATTASWTLVALAGAAALTISALALARQKRRTGAESIEGLLRVCDIRTGQLAKRLMNDLSA